MPIRIAPYVLLSAAIAASLALAALMLGLTMDQRWLGLRLNASPDRAIAVPFEGLWIDAAHPNGPAAALPGGVESLVAITDANGRTIRLEPLDLLDEPDVLPTYGDMQAFFDRQSQIFALLESRPVTLQTRFLSETRHHVVRPDRQRPASSLPAAFWMQIGVGLAGFWIGAWVWSLRRGEWATRFLGLAGAGLMISAFAAAVYSTRELAIDGAMFATLSRFNHFGAILFGVGLIGLFLEYPRRLVRPRWLFVPPLALGGWFFAHIMQWFSGPPVGFHLPVVLAMTTILVLVAIQLRVTSGDPQARAALTWLGLSVAIGAGAFVVLVIAPNLLGLPPMATQGEAFLLFLLVFVGVALGVARFRLFQLDEWAFRILFYVMGVMLLIALDALLILTIVDERAPAFALSLLLVAIVWLPLRDTLARAILHRRDPSRENLFPRVVDVALSPEGHDQQARWLALLDEAFAPLHITPTAAVRAPVLVNDGLALVLPDPIGKAGLRMEYAARGRKLFSPRDTNLATELCAMLATALESREAFEKGVAEERIRIARDIHDNVGVQLMGALHSREQARKDQIIRETLTDLRDIINNASRPELPFDEMLADLRMQTSEHLHAAGIRMNWEVNSVGPTVLSLHSAHTLRSILRETVQNALRHAGAGNISVSVAHEGGVVTVTVTDDGKGFDAESPSEGNGLPNMRARVDAIGGQLNVTSGPDGTTVRAQFPVQTGLESQ